MRWWFWRSCVVAPAAGASPGRGRGLVPPGRGSTSPSPCSGPTVPGSCRTSRELVTFGENLSLVHLGELVGYRPAVFAEEHEVHQTRHVRRGHERADEADDHEGLVAVVAGIHEDLVLRPEAGEREDAGERERAD